MSLNSGYIWAIVRVSGAKLLILTALIFWIFTSDSFAATVPGITEPVSGSTVTGPTPKLIWENTQTCPGSGSCYMVEVDDNSDFTNPEKNDIYTDNNYYSPQNLSEGNWYWRVKAKDGSGVWSDWASSSFVLSNTQSTSTPTPSPSPSNSNTSGQPSVSSDSPQGGTAAFSIQLPVNSLDVNSSVKSGISLVLPSNPNQTFFIKGAFIKPGGTNYFGKSMVKGNWVLNGSSYSNQLLITTDADGSWSGGIDVMPDNADSGFTGEGNYTFKVGRYNDSGSGPVWSNEISLHISGNQAAPSATAKTSGTTATPGPTAITAATVKQTAPTGQSISPVMKTHSPDRELNIASISGESTEEAAIYMAGFEDKRSFNWLYILAGITLLGATVIGIILKYNVRLTFAGP